MISYSRTAKQDERASASEESRIRASFVASLLRKEQHMEFPPFQSRQEVVIHASLQAVWEFNQDLTNIAQYHPRVKRVGLISEKSQREQGIAYRCYLKDGKNTCVETDLEVVPNQTLSYEGACSYDQNA